MNRGFSNSGGRDYGGGNGLSSWIKNRLSYVDTNKRSGDIISHDNCRRRTGDYIVKARSKYGMRNKNGHLDDIWVEHDCNLGYNIGTLPYYESTIIFVWKRWFLG